MSLNQTHNYLCQQGSSNKFYTLMLNSTSGGWVVLSHYGRTGTAGTQRVVKSQSSYFAALEAFEAACKKGLHAVTCSWVPLRTPQQKKCNSSPK